VTLFYNFKLIYGDNTLKILLIAAYSIFNLGIFKLIHAYYTVSQKTGHAILCLITLANVNQC